MASVLHLWDGPIESDDRLSVRPGRDFVELEPRVGDPILVWADVTLSAGSVVTLRAGTEP